MFNIPGKTWGLCLAFGLLGGGLAVYAAFNVDPVGKALGVKK